MRRIWTSNVLALMALAAAMTIPAAAQMPNFNGTWKLDLAKSFMAGDHPAKDYELTMILAQQGSSIQQTDIAVHVSMMNIPMPDSKTTINLIADGEEHETPGTSPFPGMRAMPMNVSAEWQGGTLVVTETSQSPRGASITHRRYFLSAYGSQLIELVEGHSGFGDTEQRLIFDKQP